MVLNGSSKINSEAGDYLVLVDGGCEGFNVFHQSKTYEDAIHWMAGTGTGQPQTLVKLVRVVVSEVEA